MVPKEREKPIHSWPPGERPREILQKRGAEHLSNAQLLATVFRTGISGKHVSAADLGRDLLFRFHSFSEMDRAPFAELLQVRGLGPAKVASVKAALEIGRRFMSENKEPRQRFTGSREVAGHFSPILRNLSKEVFLVALLNGRNEMVREVTVSVGSLTSSLVHPREVFQPAVRESAASIILIHNHPSGDPTPSQEDRTLTERLVAAGKILGIKVLDHVIVASRGYISLMENGTGRPR